MSYRPLPFNECDDESRFGGKIIGLCRAARHGLPVPPGYGLEVALVDAVVAGDAQISSLAAGLFDEFAPAVAVRSSGIGEDAADASFAGQHDSIMNVRSGADVLAAIVDVYRSAHTSSVLAYRERMGVEGEPRIAVAIQKQIPSEMAGVMFTRNPSTGDNERYVEVSLGLGEAVVAGMVVPDTLRFDVKGKVLSHEAGEKDVRLILNESGGTSEEDVEGDAVTELCLGDEDIAKLHDLASRCEAAYGEGLDMEFAFYQGQVYLLQCRAITKLHAH